MPVVPRSFVLSAALLVTALFGCRSSPKALPVATDHRPPPLTYSQLQQLAHEEGWQDGNPDARQVPPEEIGNPASRIPPHPAGPAAPSNPLLLPEVIELALRSSPNLQMAHERLAIAEFTLARARAELYPKFTFSQQYAATNNPAQAFSFQLNQAQLTFDQDINHPGTIDDFHSRFRLEQRLYAGQQRNSAACAGEALQSSASHDLSAARNELVFAAAEAYFRLLQARDLASVSAQAVAQVAEHLKTVRARYEADTAMRSDVLTVEVRFAEVREAHIAAENRLRLAWAVLRNVTGADIQPRPLPLEIPVAPWSRRIESLQLAVRNGLQNRPEIEAIAGRHMAAAEDIRFAKAAKRPSVDLIADYDLFTGDLSDANDSYFVGLILQWNLFDAGRTSSDVQRASARLRELQAQQRRLMLDIELDVQRSWLAFSDSRERLQVSQFAIQQAEQNLHDIELRFRNDMATTAELMDAQLSLSAARVRMATAQAEMQIAAASLERAIGSLCATIEGT